MQNTTKKQSKPAALDTPIPLRPVDIPAAPAPGPSRQVSVMGAAADELGDIVSELTTLTLAISACTSGASIRDHGDDMIRTVDRIVERIRRVQLELVDGRLPPAEVSR